MAGETHTLTRDTAVSHPRTDVIAPVPLKACQRVFERWGIPAIALGTSQQAALILDIYEGVYALMRNPNSERAWIGISRADLGNRSLLALISGGSLDELILARDFVDFANGR